MQGEYYIKANMWITKIAVSFSPLMHASLISRSNVASSNMCMIYETSTTKILQIKF